MEPVDLVGVVGTQFVWGLAAGLGLTMWAYEPVAVRRVGELVALLGVLVYLVVGVLAGENLASWLRQLPPKLGAFLFDALIAFREYNPFGVVRYWLDPVRDPATAVARMTWVTAIGLGLVAVMGGRAGLRLKGHFHDRHYKPVADRAGTESDRIGTHPLSWWAVRRVQEYSGRVNIWLAGGFGLVYAAYTLAEGRANWPGWFADLVGAFVQLPEEGSAWPAWMGKAVFQVFEQMGGLPALATGLVVLAAVPAAFQYGLWDPTPQDRARRLELLLLTRLGPRDYWDAAQAAAWRRGRGYFAVAVLLWGALVLAGAATPVQALASAAAGVVLWGFAFALGFRAFASGAQANGLGALLTLGLPLAAWGLLRFGSPELAALTPPGAVYVPLCYPLSPLALAGPVLTGAAALVVARTAMANCDRDLRLWYDRNSGRKVMD